MKRFLACFLVFILMLGSACAEESDKTIPISGTIEAKDLRSYLQSHYKVSVRIGDECLDAPIEGFEVGICLDTLPYMAGAYTQNLRYEKLVRLLKKALYVYSQYFFCLFSPRDATQHGGISFMLVDSITYEGYPSAGMFCPDGNWLRIWLSASFAEERTVHYEIWHAAEYWIQQDDPEAFSDWNSLNPEGFGYSGSNELLEMDNGNLASGDWFVRDYGKYDEQEDRATVYGAIMTQDEEWWKSRPHLQKKAEYLLDKMKEHFVYWPFLEE